MLGAEGIKVPTVSFSFAFGRFGDNGAVVSPSDGFDESTSLFFGDLGDLGGVETETACSVGEVSPAFSCEGFPSRSLNPFLGSGGEFGIRLAGGGLIALSALDCVRKAGPKTFSIESELEGAPVVVMDGI